MQEAIVASIWEALGEAHIFNNGSVACRWGKGFQILSLERQSIDLGAWGSLLKQIVSAGQHIAVTGTEYQTTAFALGLMQSVGSAAWFSPCLSYAPGGFPFATSPRFLDCLGVSLASVWSGELEHLGALVCGTEAIEPFALLACVPARNLHQALWRLDSIEEAQMSKVFDWVVTFEDAESLAIGDVFSPRRNLKRWKSFRAGGTEEKVSQKEEPKVSHERGIPYRFQSFVEESSQKREFENELSERDKWQENYLSPGWELEQGMSAFEEDSAEEWNSGEEEELERKLEAFSAQKEDLSVEEARALLITTFGLEPPPMPHVLDEKSTQSVNKAKS
jgi:hypothetical protein